MLKILNEIMRGIIVPYYTIHSTILGLYINEQITESGFIYN